MLREGRELAKVHPNITVKVPLTKEGLQACKVLRSEGVAVNVTLVFSPMQALLAAKVDATYVSPFVGRLDDVATEGMDLIAEIRAIYDNYGFATQILAASIRHPVHVLQAALAGADVATIPYKVLLQLYDHPLTDVGIKRFLQDWEKLKATKK